MGGWVGSHSVGEGCRTGGGGRCAGGADGALPAVLASLPTCPCRPLPPPAPPTWSAGGWHRLERDRQGPQVGLRRLLEQGGGARGEAAGVNRWLCGDGGGDGGAKEGDAGRRAPALQHAKHALAQLPATPPNRPDPTHKPPRHCNNPPPSPPVPGLLHRGLRRGAGAAAGGARRAWLLVGGGLSAWLVRVPAFQRHPL